MKFKKVLFIFVIYKIILAIDGKCIFFPITISSVSVFVFCLYVNHY